MAISKIQLAPKRVLSRLLGAASVVVLASGGLLAGPASPASASTAFTQLSVTDNAPGQLIYFNYITGGNNLCLDGDSGGQADVWSCGAHNNHIYFTFSFGTKSFMIYSDYDGYCLGVPSN